MDGNSSTTNHSETIDKIQASAQHYPMNVNMIPQNLENKCIMHPLFETQQYQNLLDQNNMQFLTNELGYSNALDPSSMSINQMSSLSQAEMDISKFNEFQSSLSLNPSPLITNGLIQQHNFIQSPFMLNDGGLLIKQPWETSINEQQVSNINGIQSLPYSLDANITPLMLNQISVGNEVNHGGEELRSKSFPSLPTTSASNPSENGSNINLNKKLVKLLPKAKVKSKNNNASLKSSSQTYLKASKSSPNLTNSIKETKVKKDNQKLKITKDNTKMREKNNDTLLNQNNLEHLNIDVDQTNSSIIEENNLSYILEEEINEISNQLDFELPKQELVQSESNQLNLSKLELSKVRTRLRTQSYSERKLLPLLPQKSNLKDSTMNIYTQPHSAKTNDDHTSPNLMRYTPNQNRSYNDNLLVQLQNKSNYQLLLEGKNKDLGLDFGPNATMQVERKRKAHKDAERFRRQALNDQFHELRKTIKGLSEKESKFSVLSHAKELIIKNVTKLDQQSKQINDIMKMYASDYLNENTLDLESEDELEKLNKWLDSTTPAV